MRNFDHMSKYPIDVWSNYDKFGINKKYLIHGKILNDFWYISSKFLTNKITRSERHDYAKTMRMLIESVASDNKEQEDSTT